jgi:hypothetical protein
VHTEAKTFGIQVVAASGSTARRRSGAVGGLPTDVFAACTSNANIAAGVTTRPLPGTALSERVRTDEEQITADHLVNEIARKVHAHPTLGEGVQEAIHGLAGHMINLSPARVGTRAGVRPVRIL